MEKKTYLFELATRHYELDSFYHINNTNYFRYIEEARVQMMGEQKFPVDLVRSSNTMTLLTRLDGFFRSQVRHPETLVIESRQREVRKVRGVLRQVIRRKSDSTVCFEADAHWAYVNGPGGSKSDAVKFASIFGAMADNAIEPFSEISFPERTRIIDKANNNKIVKVNIEVRPYELDAYQHVNNAVYSNYFEFGRWKLFEFTDSLRKRLKDLGLNIILYRSTIEFIKPSLVFEKLTLRNMYVEISAAKIITYHELSGKRNELKSRVRAEVCVINSFGKPVRIPAEILESLRPYIIS
ncbi:MAG: acyl-[acyl-carrier-protein] thioesterase [Leptospira sp.]|nr:acyl-[acyl-carrier-protein] thioesterase [Leptospira sp.]